MKIKSFVIPEHIVPARRITRCYDCPWFENRGGSYGEYHRCLHDGSAGEDLQFRGGNDIAEGCPMLDIPEELT
jgi:hypothetical protein